MSVAEQERPEDFWRDATSADVARAMEGEVVEARFRDHDPGPWFTGKLRGGKILGGVSHWMTSRASWTQCQVYDPPQWFVDKPEPGEGCRLLGKFPDEAVQGGDFAFDRSMGWTELNSGCNPAQAEGIWYRRRIEQPKPEPKHYVLRVGDTCDAPKGRFIKATENGVEVN